MRYALNSMLCAILPAALLPCSPALLLPGATRRHRARNIFVNQHRRCRVGLQEPPGRCSVAVTRAVNALRSLLWLAAIAGRSPGGQLERVGAGMRPFWNIRRRAAVETRSGHKLQSAKKPEVRIRLGAAGGGQRQTAAIHAFPGGVKHQAGANLLLHRRAAARQAHCTRYRVQVTQFQPVRRSFRTLPAAREAAGFRCAGTGVRRGRGPASYELRDS